MIRLFKQYPELLLFGLLTSMLSGPGQTFLVALFIPDIQKEFGWSSTFISSVYSLATLLSAAVLPFWGKLLDKVRLDFFTIGSMVFLAFGCFVLGISNSVVLVFIGFFLIRNLGQGTLPLISSTTMARFFGSRRGKALGIAALGYPLSEAIFPIGVSSLIVFLGWRSTWNVVALVTLLVFLPLILILLWQHERKYDPNHEILIDHEKGHSTHTSNKHWVVKEVLCDWRFYMLLLPVLIPPMYVTGLFFHQVTFIQSKSWSLDLISLGLMVYGISRAPVSFLIGPLIDKFTAKKLFPTNLFPMALGILLLILGQNENWIFPYLALCGITVGLGMTMSSAMWAELYGTKNLGSIRGLMSSMMVISTAIAPVLLGILIDMEISIIGILWVMFFVNILGITLSYFALQTKGN